MKHKFLVLAIAAVMTAVSVAGQDAGKYMDDPYVEAQLKKSVVMKKAAIGLGVGGGVMVAAGIGMNLGSLAMSDGPEDDIGPPVDLNVASYPVFCIGGAAVITAIVLGSVSPRVAKKAIKRYDRSSGVVSYHEVWIGIEPTAGGAGLQLTF